MKINQTILISLIIGFLFPSCREQAHTDTRTESKIVSNKWTLEKLSDKAAQHLDSNHWDLELFKQDIETYAKYADIFQNYPLNKSPFPVAGYDYAVSSRPFVIETETALFKGIRIGEYESPESDKIIDKLTLLILTNDKNSEENSLVESRNYPYLTAQGTFNGKDHEYDWVFSASPDGFSTLLVNMKLFDLRFGETILIFPQAGQSFFYEQVKDSPNNYEGNFEEFKKELMNNPNVKNRLESETNS